MVVPNSGHDIQLHKNAPPTSADILDWVKHVSPPHER